MMEKELQFQLRQELNKKNFLPLHRYNIQNQCQFFDREKLKYLNDFSRLI